MFGIKQRLLRAAGAAAWLLAAACGAAPQQVNWVTLDKNIPIDQLHVAPTSVPPAAPVAMSQAEARAALPFDFGVPAWAPDGFQLQDSAAVVAAPGAAYASVSLSWENADGAQINLTVSQSAPGDAGLAGAGSTQSVQVNGQPASLRQSKGLGAGRLTLSWARAGLDYRLAGATDTVDGPRLVQMAESIP